MLKKFEMVTQYIIQMKNDPRSCDRNFYNCVEKPEKNSGLQRGFMASSPIEVLNFFNFLMVVCSPTASDQKTRHTNELKQGSLEWASL